MSDKNFALLVIIIFCIFVWTIIGIFKYSDVQNYKNGLVWVPRKAGHWESRKGEK